MMAAVEYFKHGLEIKHFTPEFFKNEILGINVINQPENKHQSEKQDREILHEKLKNFFNLSDDFFDDEELLDEYDEDDEK